MSASVLLWSLTVYLVRAQSDSLDSCNVNLNLMKEDKIVNVNEMCKKTPCLTKCCAENQILFGDGTQVYCNNTRYLEKKYNVANLEDYSRVKIYNKEKNETEKEIKDFILLHYDNFVPCDFYLQIDSSFYFSYILEDGRLHVQYNFGDRDWFDPFEMGTFCFENYLDVNTTSSEIIIYKVESFDGDEVMDYRIFFNTYGMMVSCFFMLVVLVVYGLLKELRNLAGIMLMAYMATFLVFFLLRIGHVYGSYMRFFDPTGCIVMTLFVYHVLLSSFCWMNIMSFDIWWTLRAIRKHQPTNRRGILVKFGWYALYAWGVPLLAVLIVVVADNIDLPYYVKPNVFQFGGCFFGDEGRMLYVCMPITILVVVNIILFLMTAYNIWRVRRAISQDGKETRKTTRKNETRFSVYLKLSLLMGICWIFEVMEILIDNNHWAWYIADAYNTSIGLFIFILFVCKRELFLRLCTRLSIDNHVVRSLRAQSSRSNQVTSTQHSSRSVQDQHIGVDKNPFGQL